MNKKILLISFEGIDGSGKTTLIKKLKEKLPDAYVAQSPWGTDLGKKVRYLVTENLIKRELNVWTEFFLFTANHSEHYFTVIKPNLEARKIVLIDRYIDSTLIYQGIRGKLPISKLLAVWKNSIELPVPDLSFVLDITPTKTQARVNKRRVESGEEPNNWDNSKLEFHNQIRNGYLELKKLFPNRIHIINAEKSQREVVEEVWKIIEKKLEENNEDWDLGKRQCGVNESKDCESCQ